MQESTSICYHKDMSSITFSVIGKFTNQFKELSRYFNGYFVVGFVFSRNNEDQNKSESYYWSGTTKHVSANQQVDS